MSVPANQTVPPVIDPPSDEPVELELQTNEEVPPVDETPVAPQPVEPPKPTAEQLAQWAAQQGWQPPQVQPVQPKSAYDQVMEERTQAESRGEYQTELYWGNRLNEINNQQMRAEMNRLQTQMAVPTLRQDLTQKGYEVDDVETMTALAIAREIPGRIDVNGQILNVDANVRNLITRALLTGNAVITGKAKLEAPAPAKAPQGPRSALVAEPTNGPISTPDSAKYSVTETERLEYMAQAEGVNVNDRAAMKKFKEENIKYVRGY